MISSSSDAKLKHASRADEIAHIMRDKKFRAADDRRLKDHVVGRIERLRTPSGMSYSGETTTAYPFSVRTSATSRAT